MVYFDEQRNNWVSTITGSGYGSKEAAKHFELRELQRRTPLTEEQRKFENLSREQIRALAEEDAMSNEQREAYLASQLDISAFINMHPEYLNTDYNANLMKQSLKDRGIDWRFANEEQLESSYQSLRDSGLLELNQAELVKLGKKRVRERVDQIVKRRASEPTQEEMEVMPLNELASRARGAL